MLTKHKIGFLAIIVSLLFMNLTLKSAVTAEFSANITADCSPILVNFQNLSTGATSYKWTFGNGNSSVQPNPGAIYINPGFYTVTLIATDGVVSDTITKTNYIEVYTDPTADFTVTSILGCVPYPVQFTNTSAPGSGPITTYLWDFGDGNTSTLKHPRHIYRTQGVYAVTLLVVDVNGCENEIAYPALIDVEKAPDVDFFGDETASCNAPLTVDFTNQTSSISTPTFQWDFGNSNNSPATNPTNTYNVFGDYTVSLTATTPNGCSSTETKIQYIEIGDMQTAFYANKVIGCPQTVFQFTDTSSPSPDIWFWDFGDGTTSTLENPTHRYTTPGNYSVSLKVTNSFSACTDSTTYINYILIDSIPVVTISATQNITCKFPVSVNFTSTANTPIQSWFWDFGDGTTSTDENPIHDFFSSANYTITLRTLSLSGCGTLVIENNFVSITDIGAIFISDVTSGCAPLDVNFLDNSITGSPIVDWLWDFGDSTTSTSQSPSHTYNTAGEFDVTLIIEDSLGCIDTLTEIDFIETGNMPTADFVGAPTISCLSDPIVFTNNSSPNADEAFWLFGDGGISTELNPIYTYGDTGLFTVALVAIDNGCTDTIIKENYIQILAPAASFNIVKDCDNPYDIQFQETTVGADTWDWGFGDAQTSTLNNPNHTYLNTGTYNITLTVTSFLTGCSHFALETIVIADLESNFVATDTLGCAPFDVIFQDLSQDAQSWKWYFGDGDSSTLQNPTHTYNNAGYYTITQKVVDINGCIKTITRTDYIKVHSPTPLFSGTPVDGCAPLNVVFSDSSTAFLANIVNWKWYFGDGDSSSQQNPGHYYPDPGNFNITLSVTDDKGCENAVTYSQFVRPTFPAPSFMADTLACTRNDFQFVNTSSGVNLNYIWYFGDGDTSSATNPSHLYQNEGVYTVSLFATDINGCDSMITLPNAVTVSNPIAGFFADSTFSPCPPLLVNFADSSSSDIIGWLWDFGDGVTSVLKNPQHVYLEPDTYTVTLITTSITGCQDTMTKSNYITVLGPYGALQFDLQNDCFDNEITFITQTYNTVAITYDFGDGIVINAGDTVYHTYLTTGVYHPAMILDDGQGCLHTITTNDSITIATLTPEFDIDTNYLCKSGTINFTDLSISYPAITNWLWNFGNGVTDTIQNPSYYYILPGGYSPSLIVSNGYCTDTIEKIGLIDIDPGPQAAFSADTQACIPIDMQFTDLTTSDSLLGNWTWTFGTGDSSSLQSPLYTYDTIGSFDIQLIVASIVGCSDTANSRLTVYPLPTVFAGNDTSICSNEQYTINATGGTQYAWTPTTGLSDSAIASPIANPQVSTNYIVQVTDQHGCIDYDSINIDVRAIPTTFTSPDRVICKKQTIEIWATGGDEYKWHPGFSLNDSTKSNPVALPTVTTNYVVEVTGLNKCVSYDSVLVTVNVLPVGLISGNQTICIGESTQLLADTGGIYIWSPSESLSCKYCYYPIATPDTTTQYNLFTQNQFGCFKNDTITITVNPRPNINIIATDEICAGDTINVTATGATIYDWSPSLGLSCDDCPNPIMQIYNSAQYILTANNQYNCPKNDTLDILVHPLPEINTRDDEQLCLGDYMDLTSSFSNTIAVWWTPAAGLSYQGAESPTARPDTSTNYVVEARSAFNCVAFDTVKVDVITKVLADLVDEVEICYGDTIELNVDMIDEGHLGTSVLWKPLNGIIEFDNSTVTTAPGQTREYTIIAYSGSCIPDTQTIKVTVHNNPDITVPDKVQAIEGQEVKLTAVTTNNNLNFLWTPEEKLLCSGCQTALVTVKQSDYYYVEAIDEFGCLTIDSVYINMLTDCVSNIFVPNTFTPNNDGVNDVLKVRGLSLLSLRSFQIYDRWGRMIFETNDINKGWDGSINGKKAKSGVYIYNAQTECTNGEIAVKAGNVTLIK